MELEGNKLIALFWGYKYYPADKWYKINGYKEHYFIENDNHEVYENKTHRTLLTDMQFHEDWSWLMPVCKKWDDLSEKENSIFFEYNEFKTQYIKLSDKLDDLVTCYDITPVFNQLVENIKWYNIVSPIL